MNKLFSFMLIAVLSQSAFGADNPGYFGVAEVGLMDLNVEKIPALTDEQVNFVGLGVGYRYHDEISWDINYGQNTDGDGKEALKAALISAKVTAKTKGAAYVGMSLGLSHSRYKVRSLNDSESGVGIGVGVGLRNRYVDVGLGYNYVNDSVNTISCTVSIFPM